MASKSAESKTPLRHLYLILALCSFIVYVNGIGNDYNMDDEFVTNGNKLTSQGISGIPDILASPYYSDADSNDFGYRPVVLISFALEHEFLGESAQVSHFLNVICFVLLVLLLFNFLNLLLGPGNAWMNFFISLLFALHPIHTEVVDSIKNRDEIFSLLFSLMALIFLLRYSDKKSYLSLLASLGFFMIALFSKKSCAGIAPVFPAVLILFRRSDFRQSLLICVLFLMVLIPFWTKDEAFSFLLRSIVLLFAVLFLYNARTIMDAYRKTGNLAETVKSYHKHWFAKLEQSIVQQLSGSLIISSFITAVILILWNIHFQIYIPAILFVFCIPVFFLNRNNDLSYVRLIIIPVGVLAVILQEAFLIGIPVIAICLSIENFSKIDKKFREAAFWLVLSSIFSFFALQKTLFLGIPVFLGSMLAAELITRGKKLITSIIFIFLAVIAALIAGNPWNSGSIIFSLYALMVLVYRSSKPWYHLRFLGLILIIASVFLIAFPLYMSKPLTKKVDLGAAAKLSENHPTKTVLGIPGEGRQLTFVENPLIADRSFTAKYATALYVTAWYAKLMIVPYPLRYFYGYATVDAMKPYDPLVIVSFLVLLLLAWLALRYSSEIPLLSFGIIWFLAGIAIFSNATELVAGVIGERLAFTASAGFCMAILAYFFHHWQRRPVHLFKDLDKRVIYPVLFIACVYFVMTLQRNAQWKDVFTLTEADMPHLEKSAKAHNFLATQHILLTLNQPNSPEKTQHIQIASEHFEKAALIYSGFLPFWYDLGRTRAMLGKWSGAASAYRKGAELDTSNTQIALDCAYASQMANDKANAIRFYYKVADKEINNSFAYSRLCELLLERKDTLAVKDLANTYRKNNPADGSPPFLIYCTDK